MAGVTSASSDHLRRVSPRGGMRTHPLATVRSGSILASTEVLWRAVAVFTCGCSTGKVSSPPSVARRCVTRRTRHYLEPTAHA
jgi:hypothetical protein